MQQFFSSINFCLRNIGYLVILCLPVMTLEVALANLIASLDFQASSDAAALEAISEISGPVFILVLASLINRWFSNSVSSPFFRVEKVFPSLMG